MSIINCKECGTLCKQNPMRLCARCQGAYLEAENKVADYLRNNMNATLMEVHRATGVAEQVIMKMIREGRVIEGEMVYPCESCGGGITSGRFCKNCEESLLDSLKAAGKEEEAEKTGQGMHISQLYDK